MPAAPTEIGPDDDAVFLHLAQMLGEHFFRCIREHFTQLTEPNWPVLKLRQNPQLPLPLEKTDRDLSRPFILGLARQTDLNLTDAALAAPGSLRA